MTYGSQDELFAWDAPLGPSEPADEFGRTAEDRAEWHHARVYDRHTPQPDMERLYIQPGTGAIEAPCLHPDCAAVHEIAIRRPLDAPAAAGSTEEKKQP